MPVIRAETVGPVVLVLGDCLIGAELTDFVPPGSAAAIITDPPYCSGGFTEASRRTAKSMGVKSEKLGWFEGDNMTTLGLQFLLRAIAVDSYTMLRPGGTLSMFMDWRMIPAVAPAVESARLRWQQLVLWDKQSMGMGIGFRAQHETILHFAKGTPSYYGARNGNVLRAGRPRSQDREHPTEKPTDLLAKIIDTVAEPGALLVDWFGGAGSLGVAAIETGRRAVVFEVDPVFHERAIARCRAALGKASLFVDLGASGAGATQAGLLPAEVEPISPSGNPAPESFEPDASIEVEKPEVPIDPPELDNPAPEIDKAAPEPCESTAIVDAEFSPAPDAPPPLQPGDPGYIAPLATDDLDEPYESAGPRLEPLPQFDEAASSAEFDRLAEAMRAQAAKPCERCRGEGWVYNGFPGGVPMDCPRCGGAGTEGVRDELPADFVNMRCPKCEGRLNPEQPGAVCDVCRGYGSVHFYALPVPDKHRDCTRTGQTLRCYSRLCHAAGRCTRAGEIA